MRNIARALVVLVAAFLVLACDSSPEAKRAEAAASYSGQQADCIANNKGREAIDACRNRVKAAWSNDAGAGTEGGAK